MQDFFFAKIDSKIKRSEKPEEIRAAFERLFVEEDEENYTQTFKTAVVRLTSWKKSLVDKGEWNEECESCLTIAVREGVNRLKGKA